MNFHNPFKVMKSLMLVLIIALSMNSSAQNSNKDDKILYLGYGSNMSEEYMKKYAPSLEYIMNVQLPNYEIQFRKYSTDMKGGISSIIEKPGGMIYAVLYWISKKEMEALDLLEDVPLGIYKRETFQVLGEDGKWYAADLYRVTTPKGPYTPSKQYLDIMIAGAKEHHINKDWITKLEKTRAELD